MAGLRSDSLFARQFGDEAPDASGMQRDGDAVGRHVDPLDKQPEEQQAENQS